MTDLIKSSILLLVLLNPFLLIIYFIDVVQKLDRQQFSRVLLRAGLIATVVFWLFSALGDSVSLRSCRLSLHRFRFLLALCFCLSAFNLSSAVQLHSRSCGASRGILSVLLPCPSSSVRARSAQASSSGRDTTPSLPVPPFSSPSCFLSSL